MGCIGAARLALERSAGASSFIGFGRLDRSIEVSHDRCELCTNICRITHATIEGMDEKPSWGYMCGREPDGPALPMKHDRGFRLLDGMMRRGIKRTNDAADADAPVIGLPRSLSTYGLAPFWAGFCESLGLKLKLDGETDAETKESGNALAAADFCFPVKAHLGHVKRVLEDPEADYALVPYFISDAPNEHTSASLLCPYVESSPSVYRALDDSAAERLLAPIVDLRWSRDKQARELLRCFDRVVPGMSIGRLKKALGAGLESHRQFADDAVTAGSKLLARISEAGEKAFVFVGRPYNVRDQGLNLGIPRHFARLGAHVLPLEMLPFRPESLADDFRNVFWAYGQRILSAVRQVGEQENVFPVYLSNFNCGPDSFLLTYAEEMMKDKPFLVLELDEHGTEGGYLTRIEAFLDVVDGVGKATSRRKLTFPDYHLDEFKNRKMWLPPLHPVIGRLFAAGMRAEGMDAEMMPVEDVASFERGRQVTRGSECLPTCTTIGRFLNILEERDLDPSKQAFFMATASGPCRFGQYALLHRNILDREGYEDIPILSPSSFNSYQGVGESLRRTAWKLFLIGDMLFKARCKVAPYEVEPGAAVRALEESIVDFERTVEAGGALKSALERAMGRFAAVPVSGEKKPLVGIVGEIYVRCSPFTNDFLVEAIERYGGEAWLAPASEWFLYTAQDQAWTAGEGLSGMTARAASVLKNRFMKRDEKVWYSAAGEFMADRHEPPIDEVLKAGMRFIPMNFAGEAIITVGRAILFAREGADMVVNAAPFGCMPGTLTTAILSKIQDEEGVPMVGMFYDGTPGLNKVLEPYINGLDRTASAAIRHGVR